MEKKRKKKFKLMDAVLGTVCLTLVCESVMQTAAIGSQQYFWWIFLLICFCLPYGMITAELGTTYPSEGGMYDWVKRAFGPKWAGRVAWNYWRFLLRFRRKHGILLFRCDNYWLYQG